MTNLFHIPTEGAIEIFNSFLVKDQQTEVMTEDLIDVLNSYFYGEDKVTMSIISSLIPGFDKLNVARKKEKII
jgi:hypothetical protein